MLITAEWFAAIVSVLFLIGGLIGWWNSKEKKINDVLLKHETLSLAFEDFKKENGKVVDKIFAKIDESNDNFEKTDDRLFGLKNDISNLKQQMKNFENTHMSLLASVNEIAKQLSTMVPSVAVLAEKITNLEKKSQQ